jgi:HTH-type transcriptional regulator, sugar sensing transcriptional regulator
MDHDRIQPEQSLTQLGFTETEALVYCELLRASPASGYRLAQAIGKAPANTYQALSALTQKGAVLADGASKTFRAVPPAELIAGLEAGFERRARAAAHALERVFAPSEDDRIYQLKTPAQVMARARALIGAAREILLFDLFPEPLTELLPALESAAAAGVTLAGVTYGPPPATTFPCVGAAASDFIRDRWPGRQVGVVADAAHYLMALLSHDGGRVLHGVGSDSAYLAALQHSALATEIRFTRLKPTDDPLAHLSLLSARPAGLRRLVGDDLSDLDPAPVQGDAA